MTLKLLRFPTKHVRKRDLKELLERGRAVNARGLVKILGNIHQNTRCHEHDVRNSDPDIDDDQKDLGDYGRIPERNKVVGNTVVMNKRNLLKHTSDQARGREQLGYVKQ